MYRILRHGGWGNNTWRIVIETDDKVKAVRQYNSIYRKMRQGGIVMMKDVEVIKTSYAPRLWNKL